MQVLWLNSACYAWNLRPFGGGMRRGSTRGEGLGFEIDARSIRVVSSLPGLERNRTLCVAVHHVGDVIRTDFLWCLCASGVRIEHLGAGLLP